MSTPTPNGFTRRSALAGFASFLAGARLLRGQQDPFPLYEQKRALGLEEMQNVWDFEAVFNANLPVAVHDYTAHGDGTEWTTRRNRQAFEWVDILPGRPVDPKSVDLSTKVFNTRMKVPIMVAPTALHGAVHPEGEAASHRGASAAGAPYIVAHMPSVPMPKVAAAGNGPLWYQFYGDENVEANRPALELAQQVGCEAIVVTVDQAASYYPRTLHDRNLMHGREMPPGREPRGKSGAARYGADPRRLWYTWSWLDEVRKFVRVPMVVKGIMTPEDAVICADRGLGVIVSNHGGRSLDYDPSTLEILAEIVDAVRGRVPVLFDSGIRRGSDAFKALALGADAVCIGRAQRWGLGAFGAPGVQRVLEILQQELTAVAAASGHAGRGTINRSAIVTHFT